MNRGREEPPELPQGDRQREEKPRPEAHRQRNGEGLGDAECDRFALAGWQRMVQPIEDMTVEPERERTRECACDQYNEESRPQLFEMSNERRFLTVPKAT